MWLLSLIYVEQNETEIVARSSDVVFMNADEKRCNNAMGHRRSILPAINRIDFLPMEGQLTLQQMCDTESKRFYISLAFYKYEYV